MPAIAEDFKAINAGLKKLEGKAVDEPAAEPKAEDVQAPETYWGGLLMGPIPLKPPADPVDIAKVIGEIKDVTGINAELLKAETAWEQRLDEYRHLFGETYLERLKRLRRPDLAEDLYVSQVEAFYEGYTHWSPEQLALVKHQQRQIFREYMGDSLAALP